MATSPLLLPTGDDFSAIKIDQPYAALKYVGVARETTDPAKSLWRIYRETFAGGVHTQEFAISGKYVCSWNARATYFAAAPADVLDTATDVVQNYALDASGNRMTPATEVTLASILAGLATLAKDTSLSSLAKDSSLAGLAKDTTLASLLTRANLQATEATLAAVSPVLRTATCTMLSPISVALSSVVVAAANAARKGIIMWNNSSNSTYVTFGPTSVAARCTNIIATFQSWQHTGPVCYTGQISAIRNAGSGEVVCWELT